MATVLMPAVPDHHPDDGQRHRHRGKKPRNWVRWEPPNPGWLKLNTDGASKGNPGLSGGGSILRDPNGNVIFQTFRGYGVQTALVAEFLALTDGIKTFCDLGLMDSGFKLVIESDSTTLIKALCRTIAVPREIMPYWHLLDFLMPFLEGMVDAVHVYREGNTEADYLANRGVMVHREMMMVNQVLNPTVLFCEGFHSGSRLAAPWNYRISPCLIHNCVVGYVVSVSSLQSLVKHGNILEWLDLPTLIDDDSGHHGVGKSE
ncbi:hypothetical protein ACLB2K_045378 [Fragaria x ananassa]